ncbi:hypothetical protein ACHAXT_004812 [Thalassiosira profunda]
MSSLNGEDATPPSGTTTPGASGAASHTAGPAAGAKGKANKQKKAPPALPSLGPEYNHVQPIIVSQRPTVRKILVGAVTAMLVIVKEIGKKRDAVAKYTGTFVDSDDPDENGSGRIKSFIPNSLRAAMPLNHSKRVKKDRRCAQAYAEITTLTGEARNLYDKYRQDMAGLFKRNAELEIKARLQILTDQYLTLLVDIAEAMVIVAKQSSDYEPNLDDQDLAFSAVHDACASFPDNHWEELPFTASSSGDVKANFWNGLEKKFGIKYEGSGGIKTKRDALPHASGNEGIIQWVSAELEDLIPGVTTEFWEARATADLDNKIEAALQSHFKKKEVDDATEALAQRMEVDDGDTLRDAVREEVSRQTTRNAAHQKKAARKKSSGNSKDQESARTNNGGKRSGRSSPQRDRSESRRSKRSFERSGHEGTRRDSRRPRHDDRRRDESPPHHYYRDSRSYSRERNYARRSRTPPPRARYYREESPRHHRSNDRYQRRGGRGGRGGYNRGRRGENGNRR